MRHRGRVLVTRSEPGAESLARALRAAQFTVVVVPMIEVVGVSADDEIHKLPRLGPADAVVFLSVHAVTHGYPLIESRGMPAGISWIAVGAATRDALRVRGVEAGAPDDERSEGILAMPQVAAARRVWLVGGEGGRRLLDSALAARGIDVHRMDVYRRRPTEVTDPIDLTNFAYVIVSSAAGGEALVNCSSGMPAQAIFVVPSDRVAARMKEMGACRIVVSHGAGAEAVLSAMNDSEDRDE